MTIIERKAPYGQVILFGDSLTEMSAGQGMGFNFMPALQNWYMRRLDVINRGFGGYTSRNGLCVLPQFFPTPQQATVRLLTIFFGANDSCMPGQAQHVPLEEYQSNLRAIIQHTGVQAHRPSILLITPPPIDEHALEGPAPSPRGRVAENTRKYAQAVVQVGLETDTPVLDLWTLMMQQAGWIDGEPLPGSRDIEQSPYLKERFIDGLHFNALGYKVLFTQVTNAIEKAFPDLVGPEMESPFPDWRDIHGVQGPTPPVPSAARAAING